MFGLLNVNKPAGLTSHDVVARVRRLLRRRTKVGHTGTLDPFATGVLVICVGPATRLAEHVTGQGKEYRAGVAFGAVSTTDDPEGELTPTGAPSPELEQVRAVLPEFLGWIDQVPPAHSAVKLAGRRAYHLARSGQAVQIPVRKVRIDELELLDYQAGRLELRVRCGSGTYIRALARDLGVRLGAGAYCSSIERTRVGPFRLEQAVPLEELAAHPERLPEWLLPPRMAVADWPALTLSPAQQDQLRLGRTVQAPEPLAADATGVAALDGQGQLLALCRYDARRGLLQPTKVFVLEPGQNG